MQKPEISCGCQENSDSKDSDPMEIAENSDPSKLKEKGINLTQFFSPKMFYGHATFTGNS